jgi:hypothetical protein
MVTYVFVQPMSAPLNHHQERQVERMKRARRRVMV